MNSYEYINILRKKLTNYFDIEENFSINNYILPLVGKSTIRNERYAFSKKFVLDAYENFEYCFVNYKKEEVNKAEILDFINLLKSNIKTLVTPDEEHMSSTINGIYITDTGFNKETIKIAKKFKFRKNFFFGLRGWCDIAIILVDLNKEKVYTNKQGRQSKDFYLSILES